MSAALAMADTAASIATTVAPAVTNAARNAARNLVGKFTLATASFEDMQRVGQALAQSAYYRDVQNVAQCCTKLLVGQELDLTLYETMTGIRFVEGKIEMSPSLMAARINRKAKDGYAYAVEWISKPGDVDEDGDPVVTGCRIRFYRDGVELGISKFTLADAMRAELATKANYKKYGRNMYFARAMSNGAKWYMAEIFGGGGVYVDNEIAGDDFAADPMPEEEPVATITVVEAQPVAAEPQASAEATQTAATAPAEPVVDSDALRRALVTYVEAEFVKLGIDGSADVVAQEIAASVRADTQGAFADPNDEQMPVTTYDWHELTEIEIREFFRRVVKAHRSNAGAAVTK